MPVPTTYSPLDCRAMAIGARSQAARTYLEKYLDDLRTCELEELVKHGLRALRDTLPNEVRGGGDLFLCP